VETVVKAFMDHFAVVLRLATDVLFQERGRSYWKMNISLLNEKRFCETIKVRLAVWQRRKHHYPSVVMWWTRYVKDKIKQLFASEGAERKRDLTRLENFYHEAMNTAIRDVEDIQTLHNGLEVLKGKIKRLHYGSNHRLFLGAKEQEKHNEEQPIFFHLVKKWKRQQPRHIVLVLDEEGNECTSAREMLRTFTKHLRRKC
jgi:hypothetical protein